MQYSPKQTNKQTHTHLEESSQEHKSVNDLSKSPGNGPGQTER